MNPFEGVFPDLGHEEGVVELCVESIDFVLPFSEKAAQDWLTNIAAQEGHTISNLSVIFCSDDFLLELNINYLQHDTYTDIITFPYETEPVVADLYISVERVADNAKALGVPADQELRRVMAHGLLHLCGYGDKTSEEQSVMREKEDQCLKLWVETFS